MLRLAMVVGALVIAFMFAQAADAQVGCRRCEQRLELEPAKWACLMEQLPQLSEASTPIVFFRLNPNSCRAAAGPRRSAGAGTGDVMLPQTGEDDSRVYRLSRSQLACLRENASAAQNSGGRYTFDFAAHCSG